jgi:hypothetical protein
VGARDAFIGWNPEKRQQHLHQLVNNSRFLILPWIKSKNLASRILSKAARLLPHDWKERYQYQPLLLETFVEKERFSGTCYRAANWQCVGDTTGRGKWDRLHQNYKPVKSIWLYPLDGMADTIDFLYMVLDERNISLRRLLKYMLGAPSETCKKV